MTEVQDKNVEMEQDRVNKVVQEIGERLDLLKNKAGYIGSDVLELRKTFWQDVTVNLDEPDDIIETYASIKQQAELLSERERSKTQIDKELRTLERLKNSPYFGRIDFLEDGEKSADKVYLGIASFMDKLEQEFLIYDWRAPISSLYYDFSPGPAEYNTPTETIHGDMELKRQFIIRSSSIKAMFDTGVTIGDEMLQEVLGNNANTQMKSIVATIQREQNRIIRNETSKLLFVQGVAGSGKTSAALQRVAYLLYRYRNTLSSENIMLFSPNPLFNSYVATVLPELGEENMIQTTFQEYLSHRVSTYFELEDLFEQTEYLLSSVQAEEAVLRQQSISFKSTLEFKEMIDSYVQSLSDSGLIFKNLRFRGETFISKEEIYTYFYSLDKSISIPNRIELVKSWILKELKKKAKAEINKAWVEEEVQFLDKEDFLEAFKKLQAKQQNSKDTFDDFDMERRFLGEMVVKEKLKPLFNMVKKFRFINLPQLYLKLFEHVEGSHQNWKLIMDLTVNSLKKNKLSYEDAVPFVYLQDLIEGRKSNTAIRHVFIDEAQDYTPFQFAFIKKLFPYSKVTLLGDINQAIFSGATGAASVFNEKEEEAETIVLTRTYRSTKQIVEFTRHMIDGGDSIEPFNRNGSKPSIRIIEDQEERFNALLENINSLKEDGHKTIAVICRTAGESLETFRVLEKEISVRLIEKATNSYETGVLVIPSYLSKGIEFDAVILNDFSLYVNENERKLFYTACTRAMHELHLYGSGRISPFIEDAPKDTYEII